MICWCKNRWLAEGRFFRSLAWYSLSTQSTSDLILMYVIFHYRSAGIPSSPLTLLSCRYFTASLTSSRIGRSSSSLCRRLVVPPHRSTEQQNIFSISICNFNGINQQVSISSELCLMERFQIYQKKIFTKNQQQCINEQRLNKFCDTQQC